MAGLGRQDGNQTNRPLVLLALVMCTGPAVGAYYLLRPQTIVEPAPNICGG